MIREIARLNRLLNIPHFGSQKLMATYGIEATLPKGNRGISKADYGIRNDYRVFGNGHCSIGR